MIGLDMSDAAFLEAVEGTTLPVSAFDHRAYLCLASIPGARLPASAKALRNAFR